MLSERRFGGHACTLSTNLVTRRTKAARLLNRHARRVAMLGSRRRSRACPLSRTSSVCARGSEMRRRFGSQCCDGALVTPRGPQPLGLGRRSTSFFEELL